MASEAVSAVLQALEVDKLSVSSRAPKRFCFVEGTFVASLRGEMPVEFLKTGDYIRARKGSFHTISEIDTFHSYDVDPHRHSALGLYQLRRGAIEEGMPRRDLWITEGQQFEMSRRLEISHAVRMATRKSGAAIEGLRFIVFTCDGLPMIRAEGIWITATPVEALFPEFDGDGAVESDPSGV
jgi:hypothetical protein